MRQGPLYVRSSTSWAVSSVMVVFTGELCGAGLWPASSARLWPCLARVLSRPVPRCASVSSPRTSANRHAHRTYHRKAQKAPLARSFSLSGPRHCLCLLLLVSTVFYLSLYTPISLEHAGTVYTSNAVSSCHRNTTLWRHSFSYRHCECS